MKPDPAKPPKGASIPKVAPKKPKPPMKGQPIAGTPKTPRKPPMVGKPVVGPKGGKPQGAAPTKAQKNAYDMKKTQERSMSAKSKRK